MEFKVFQHKREKYANMGLRMYKLAVEISKLSHVTAYGHEVDAETLKKLQAKCAEEVKRINGTIKFEEAYNYQREKLN